MNLEREQIRFAPFLTGETDAVWARQVPGSHT